MAAKAAKATAPKVTPAANADAASSLHLSLPQLLDLALGTPEVGAVNLNILHNFLHVLLHQINLRTTKVEYRGEDANRIKTMVASMKAGPTLHLHEYSITDKSGKLKHRIHSTDDLTVNVDVYTTEGEQKGAAAKKAKSAASAPTTAREKDISNDTDEPNAVNAEESKHSKGVKQRISPGVEGECQSVLFIEPIIDGAAPTVLAFKQLDNSVKRLQQQFQALQELTTNAEVIERLKGRITDPLTDVWQVISINNRLDASEQGIDKLTTMVQDIVKGDIAIGESTEDKDTIEMKRKIAKIETTIAALEEAVYSEDQGTRQTDTATATEPGDEKAGEMEEEQATVHKTAGRVNIQEMHRDVNALKLEMSQIRKDMYDMTAKIEHIPFGAEGDAQTQLPEGKEIDDAKLERCLEAVQTVEQKYGETLTNLDTRIQTVEKDIATLVEKVAAAASSDTGDSDLNELISKIQGIQGDMDRFGQTADRLLEDRETREMHINALLEQIELLKTIKADKEDLEDALADKADAQVVNRKVSHDQFDAACDDLARGLEDAISKLGKQESIWQQALDEVQKEIEGKVDKIEMTPLKDFVNNRLKTLQEKLKNISDAKRETEAAGTKKILRDVQCISCDKNVIMKMEDTNKYRMEPLPCSTSIKPYLTYELDRIRKQQKRLPHSKNMIQYEAVVREEAKKTKSARDELVPSPRDHLCNRYCGGSHTVTTPHQRVMRVGHFLSQWGPKTVQLTEGIVKGTDGRLYRGRMKENVCGPSNCMQCDEKDYELQCDVAAHYRKPASQNSPKKEGKEESVQHEAGGNTRLSREGQYQLQEVTEG